MSVSMDQLERLMDVLEKDSSTVQEANFVSEGPLVEVSKVLEALKGPTERQMEESRDKHYDVAYDEDLGVVVCAYCREVEPCTSLQAIDSEVGF